MSYAADMFVKETAVLKEEVDVFQMGVFQLGFTGIFCLTAVAYAWAVLLLLSLLIMETDLSKITKKLFRK